MSKNYRASDKVRDFFRDSKEKSVLFALASFANSDGTSCFVTVPRLARLLGISDRTVQRRLRDLEKAGDLITMFTAHRAVPHQNEYYIPMCRHSYDDLAVLASRAQYKLALVSQDVSNTVVLDPNSSNTVSDCHRQDDTEDKMGRHGVTQPLIHHSETIGRVTTDESRVDNPVVEELLRTIVAKQNVDRNLRGLTRSKRSTEYSDALRKAKLEVYGKGLIPPGQE